METLLLALPLGAVVGLSLGLVGAGGSLLTVPILVYVLDQPVREATTATLVIVALTALAGLAGHAGHGVVRWRTAFAFGGAAAVGTVGGTFANREVDEQAILFAFGFLMIAAAVALVRGRPSERVGRHPPLSWQVLGAGLAVGVLTGFFGVGGGFVIVPVLVLVLGLAIRDAVATSLAVIAIASATALAGHLATGGVDWVLTGVFTAAAAAGAVTGTRVQRAVSPLWLGRAFAVVVAAVGVFLVVKSLRSFG